MSLLLRRRQTYSSISDQSFKMTINTNLGAGTSFTLPLPSGQVYNFWWTPYVGATPINVTSYNDVNATYDYGVDGIYDIRVGVNVGDVCGGLSFVTNIPDAPKLTEVTKWGNVGFTSLSGAFSGCINVTAIETSTIDLLSIVRLDGFVDGCSSLTALDVSNWDLSNLIGVGLSSFARGCTSLSSLDVSSWYMTNITTLQSFVDGCINLATLDVSLWDVSNVSNLIASFRGTKLGTLNTDSWDTSSVTNCLAMAYGMTNLSSSFDANLWWNRIPAIGSFGDCFTGSTSIANYASIPNNWKGL